MTTHPFKLLKLMKMDRYNSKSLSKRGMDMKLKWLLNLIFITLLIGFGLSAVQAQSCSGPVSLPYNESFDVGNNLSDYPCWSDQYGGNQFDDVEIENNGGDMSGSPSTPYVVELNDGSAWISPEVTKLPNGVVRLKVKLAFENNHEDGFEIGLTDQPLSNPNNSLSNYTTYQTLSYVSGSPNTGNFEYTDDENWRTYTFELTDKGKIGNRTHIVFNSNDGTYECGVEDVEMTEIVKNDIRANAILSPETSCGYPNGGIVEVEYESRGASTISAGTSFPVSYTFQGSPVTETHTLSQDIATGETFTHTFRQGVNPGQDGQRYSLSATVDWNQDGNSSNDNVFGNFLYIFNAPEPQTVLGDTVCNTNEAEVKVLNPVQSGNTEYEWFNRPKGGRNIGKGTQITTPKVYSNSGSDSFYVTRKDSVTLPLKITEFRREDFPNENGVEIHNISRRKENFTGWAVVMWCQDLNNPSNFDKQVWNLGALKPGAFKMGRGNDEFDDAIFINNFGFFGNDPDPAAAAIVSPDGEVSDFVATSASAATIQNLEVDVNGYTITYNDVKWNGPAPVDGFGTPSSSGEDYWQRVGSSDNDDASDWSVNSMSPNAPNPNFNEKAFSASTCPSPAKAVGVDVRPIPEVGFSVPGQVCATDTVNFRDTTRFSGSTSLDYQWKIGSDGRFSSQNPQYTFTQSAGKYNVKLKVASQLNCRDSASRDITVNAEPVAQLDTIVGCEGKDVTLVDQSQFPGFGNLNYQWNANGQSLKGKEPALAFPSDGQYSVDLTVTSNAGCSDNTSGLAMINPTPQANFSVSDTCQGDPVQVQNQVSFAGNNSNLNYQWNFGNGQKSQMASPSPQYDSSGQYDLSLQALSADGCSEQITKKVNVQPRPFPDFNIEPTCSPKTIDLSSAVDFEGDNNNLSYNWSLGDNTTSNGASLSHTYPDTSQYTINLTATSATSNCANNVVKQVKVDPQPKPAFSTEAVCKGQTNQFKYQGDVPAESYSYDFGDGTTSAKANPNHLYTSLDTFQVQFAVGFNNQECRLTDTKTVAVNPVPTADFAFGTERAVCAGEEVQFVNNTSFENGDVNTLTYDWAVGSTGLSGESPVFPFDNEGTFDVELTARSAEGCESTFSLTKVVNPLPVSDFTLDKVGPDEVRLSAQDNTYLDYTWNLGDSTTVTAPSATYTYDSNGTYNITLMVEDRAGCTNSSSQELVLETVGFGDQPEATSTKIEAYPNPFQDVARINYSVKQQADVQLEVYTANGQNLVTETYNDRPAGSYSFNLKADRSLPMGATYLIRLQIGDKVYTKELIQQR